MGSAPSPYKQYLLTSYTAGKMIPKDPKSVSRLLRQNNDYYQSRIMDKAIHGKSTTGLLKDLLFLLHATSVKWRLHSPFWRRTLCSCEQEEATTFKVQCFNTCCHVLVLKNRRRCEMWIKLDKLKFKIWSNLWYSTYFMQVGYVRNIRETASIKT